MLSQEGNGPFDELRHTKARVQHCMNSVLPLCNNINQRHAQQMAAHGSLPALVGKQQRLGNEQWACE